MDFAEIREIKKEDNVQLAKVLRQVLIEMNVPKTGTAFADASLDSMFETYQTARSRYFVVEVGGEVFGGGGIAPLANYDGNVCELQKMYFLKEVRGLGLGSKMIDLCLNFANQQGFDACYLETMPNMVDAQKLYLKKGFKYIDAPMGDTGHCSCPVWMLKPLKV